MNAHSQKSVPTPPGPKTDPCPRRQVRPALPLLVLLAAVLVLVSAPALSALTRTSATLLQLDPGIDLWITASSGTSTAVTIPAGFFCPDSPSWSGTLFLAGEPLVTDRPTETGAADTVIERLDTAIFDSNGVATTRIQVRAISLTSTDIVTVNPCDGVQKSWEVKGVQLRPRTSEEIANGDFITELTIQRGAHGDGGTFSGTLEVPAKIVFTHGSEVRELPQDVTFLIPAQSEPAPPWASAPGSGGLVVTDDVTVDVDCDGVPETQLPGTSNFHPGWDSSGGTTVAVSVNHDAGDHLHWVGPLPDGDDGGGGDECPSKDSIETDPDCCEVQEPVGTLLVVGASDASTLEVRNERLTTEPIDSSCQLLVTDLRLQSLGAQACNARDLVVFEGLRRVPFRVQSTSPCVLSFVRGGGEAPEPVLYRQE